VSVSNGKGGGLVWSPFFLLFSVIKNNWFSLPLFLASRKLPCRSLTPGDRWMLKHVEGLTFSCVVCALCVVNLLFCVTLLTSYLVVECIVCRISVFFIQDICSTCRLVLTTWQLEHFTPILTPI
jgi:hypothetical protein